MPNEPGKLVRELSGGNQQKVIFARWLAGHIDLLLLDEPTHGVDIGAKAQIHAMMEDFAAKGGGIVFASTEMMEILAVSDSVIAMRAGNIVARISRGSGYNESALRNALHN
jgi:ABC-type sugar transport system ATPase subunit